MIAVWSPQNLVWYWRRLFMYETHVCLSECLRMIVRNDMEEDWERRQKLRPRNILAIYSAYQRPMYTLQNRNATANGLILLFICWLLWKKRFRNLGWKIWSFSLHSFLCESVDFVVFFLTFCIRKTFSLFVYSEILISKASLIHRAAATA